MRTARPFAGYLLLDRIASGGMAEVHRARRASDPDGPVVALKVVLPHYNDDREFIEMMQDEARITSLLSHPNIATTHEFGRSEDGQHYLAMEHVAGPDVRSLLRRCRELGRALPVEHCLRIAIGALRGLSGAHEAVGPEGKALKIVHRDVSPSNILLGFDGAVKVIDFGIAKAALSRARTRIGVIKGKVRYMSPEQTAGRRLDARSDIFSTGTLFYQCLTLTAPFQSPSENELMEVIRVEDPLLPSGVVDGLPAELDAIVMRALAKRPSSRFQTARAFADALQEVMDRRWPGNEPAALGAYLATLFGEERRRARVVLEEFILDDGLATAAATDVIAVVPPTVGDRVRNMAGRLFGALGGSGARGSDEVRTRRAQRSVLTEQPGFRHLVDPDLRTEPAASPMPPPAKVEAAADRTTPDARGGEDWANALDRALAEKQTLPPKPPVAASALDAETIEVPNLRPDAASAPMAEATSVRTPAPPGPADAPTPRLPRRPPPGLDSAPTDVFPVADDRGEGPTEVAAPVPPEVIA